MNKRFFMLLALLIAALLVVPVGTAEATDCDLDSPCTGGTISINITSDAQCDTDPTCTSASCIRSDTLTATAEIVMTGITGCSTTRRLAVCEKWIRSDGVSFCESCAIGFYAAGGSPHNLGAYTCTPNAAGTYAYSVQVNDITSDVSFSCSCSTACDPTQCDKDCQSQTPATAASCGIQLP